MCPGNTQTAAVNVFSQDCELLPNKQDRCMNCSEGHGGYNCEYCLEGYYGVPEDPTVSIGLIWCIYYTYGEIVLKSWDTMNCLN